MKIEKKKMADLSMVYVTAELSLQGKRYLAAASEAKGESAYIFNPETGEYAPLWKGDTGVMNIVQLPGQEKLLAIVRFYPVFQSKEAAVCLLEPTAKGYMSPWNLREVFRLPFCHRIGVVKNDNGLFILGCQLCRDKDFQEDWSQPGALFMIPVPDKPEGEWKMTKIFDGLTKNHGLFIEDENQVYICAENGVMHFDLSGYRPGDTAVPVLLTATPTSDISIAELNGQKYAGVIEPFHGNTAAVYRITDTGYEQIRRYDIDFGHVIWIGELFGKPFLIVGSRGGEKKLELINLETDARTLLEAGVGPTQISVYHEENMVKILAANHGSGEVTLYSLQEEILPAGFRDGRQ
ncbi:hypothetical protein [Marvinbryantia formatexigens]|nr:hypothetical protein [Marvinbryantia formatexigens]UWO25939.1 hypothetical protein NQ534_05575 [Marvinbryantia formatexigens DSM 14469]SDF43814.1 hypothetical protein SAMN05660368_00759 [Marvinbryantia formatexigens]